MAPSAPPGPVLVLDPDVTLEDGKVRTPRAELDLGQLSATVHTVLASALAGRPEQEALEQVRSAGPLAEAQLRFALARLAGLGVLRYVVPGAHEPLATLQATTAWFTLSPLEPPPQTPLRLSRFSLLRREGDVLVMESARVHSRVLLHHPAAAQVAWALATPRLPSEVAGVLGLEEAPTRTLVGLLARAGHLLPTDARGLTEEEREPEWATWEFHDRLFHSRSRHVPLHAQVGASFRLKDQLPPPPALKPSQGSGMELPRPDLERLARTDPPLADVMERRRSVREYAEQPLTVEQVGALLYRCARVRERIPSDLYERTRRPYPSGGATHPLEVYLAVRDCAGLEPGLFHYEPQAHALERLRAAGPELEELLEAGRVGSQPPQVLLVMTARFQRVSWKYESIAYSLLLKEAGVLLHSLQLAATAMGLAACAVGFGDAEAFARAAGLASHAETSVAEVALGSVPPGC